MFEDLARLGIGYEDVVTVLEEEGVAKFAASWQEMLDTIQTELAGEQPGEVERLRRRRDRPVSGPIRCVIRGTGGCPG